MGPRPTGRKGRRREEAVRAVALGSGGERGPLWAKVELSLLGSGAGTTSRGCAVLEDPAARRAPFIGLWAQDRGSCEEAGK